jgi:hypothetical protein
VFAVIVTGPRGAGKTVTLTALSDALAGDEVAHAAVDVDEAAWAFPYPDLAARCEHLRAWLAPHLRSGHDVVLVAEVIESQAHLADVLAALGADELLLVRLDAALETLRARIVAREPHDWPSLDFLLEATPGLQRALTQLDGVALTFDSESLPAAEIAARIRAARPDRLS